MKWNLILFTCAVLYRTLSAAQVSGNNIRIDQEGFYPYAPKTAVVVLDSKYNNPKNLFFIIRDRSTDTVFQSKLSSVRQSSNSSLKMQTADFTACSKTGTFRIQVPGYPPSYLFRINDKVHDTVAVASLKAFYYMRAGLVLEPMFAGKWNRAAGHPDDSVIIHPSAASDKRPAGSIISTPGGWYDAGDYNKYMVNSGISTSTLLSAYEDFNKYFDSLHTNIPVTFRSVPDILTEAIYNIRWMLSMQDPDDGGVYNKCSNAAFDPMIMPVAATKPRYVVQKGTAASLDFAAVMAQAARIFAGFEELSALRDSCLVGSRNAWTWASQHPDMAYDQNAMNAIYEPKIITGGYGDKKFSDEWFWAACELFKISGDKKYQDTLLKYVDQPFGLPTWSSTGLLGYYSMLRKTGPHQLNAVNDSIRTHLVQMADQYVQAASRNAFLTVMGGRKSDFNWGSNANAANQGILLLQAYFITQKQIYLFAALGNLEYICGRNATGYSFITGIGSHSPMHPHHRPSIADGISDPVPGLLAGGPNPGEQDHSRYEFHEPETAYTDQDGAYASNEIAINWNAPLVYLANAMEAMQMKLRVKNIKNEKY
jgi:endoglucanase